jgi:hypothetical protein
MRLLLFILLLTTAVEAKPKIITFGRWTTVQWMVGTDEQQTVNLRVRTLMVNGEVKELTVGEPHEITDRLFVLQRALKVNDRLPGDKSAKQQWAWRPAGWLLIDRSTARISSISLPDYDALIASPLWFRDYVAYCGLSDNGEKLYAMVVQVGRRKPLLKKQLGSAKNSRLPDGECATPEWQKHPLRVTFHPSGAVALSFAIHSFATEIPPDPSTTEGTDDGQ